MPHTNPEYAKGGEKTMEATEVRSRADTLACIYENVKMGADSIINLLPKVEDSRLKSDMSVQLSGYEKFASQARSELKEMGIEAEEKGFMTGFFLWEQV